MDKSTLKNKLTPLVHNYLDESYDDEFADKNTSKTVENIIEIMEELEKEIDNELTDRKRAFKQAHTLKHMLLYADLDDESDLAQELEDMLKHSENLDDINKLKSKLYLLIEN